MITRRSLLSSVAVGLVVGLCPPSVQTGARAAGAEMLKVSHSDAEWLKLLTPGQYAVLRRSKTERPFTSRLLHEGRRGTFACAGCDLDLFSSATKFDSGTGWPSFWAALDNAVGTTRDTTLGALRTEVHCGRCQGHVGHVFADGPRPTGLRYCMNGVALNFKSASA